jgi:hypothetical protein
MGQENFMGNRTETNPANLVGVPQTPASRRRGSPASLFDRIRLQIIGFELTRENQLVLLGAITVLAAFLRFYKLGEWSFWWDEMFTIRDVRNVSSFSLLDQRISRVLIALAVNSFGLSEWSARLVPALFGIITIPILYFPIRKIYGPGVALLASLLLAVSPWHLYWSQNARFYTIILLFYSLAMFAFYFGIEKDKPLYLLLFFIFLGIGTQERLFTLFLVPVVVLYWLAVKLLPFEKPPGLRTRNLLLLLVPSLIGGLFVGREFSLDPANWFSQFGWVNNNPFWILSGVVYYIGLPVMILGLFGAAYLLSKKERAALLLFLSGTVPIGAIMTLSTVQFSANRYVFVALSSWIILAAIAMWELLRQTNGIAKFFALGALAILIIEPMSENVLYYVYQHGNRDNWKAAFELIKNRKEPGDLIVVDNIAIGNYYMGEETVLVDNFDLESLKANGTRFWFVEDLNIQTKYPPELLNWIWRNTRLEGIFDNSVRARNFRMRVYLHEPSPP